MNLKSKIYIAGHKGLVGSSLLRTFKSYGFKNIVTESRSELDLLDQNQVKKFFNDEKPEYVLNAAARVGGIHANNSYPAEFILENLTIQNNIINNSFLTKVKKLIFLGSSCIYPKFCDQPIKEEYLMTGSLEESNSAYAIAKIAGIHMCWAFNKQYKTEYIPLMPTNLYGPNDNFDLETSHVLPALIRKFHEAKIENNNEVVVWGTGLPKREFLFVDDLADACLFVMKNKNINNELLNVGTGVDISIRDLSELVKSIVGFNGKIVWDKSKLDGTPKKCLDVSKMSIMGWKPKVSLKEGIMKTYSWYLNNIS